MKTNVLDIAKKTIGRTGLVLKKHSPKIMIVAGTVGTVTAAVMACKATLKATEVLAKTKVDIDSIHEALEVGGEEYTESMYKKDLSDTYIRTGVEIVKIYGPSVALGALSLGTVFASNNILRKRNASLTAAYATVDGAFKRYRKNVVEQYGEEVDKNLRHGIKKQEIEVTETDAKGKEKTVKKSVNVIGEDPTTYSDYARFFDEGCAEWDKSPEYNLTFLKAQQNYANDRLRAEGFLFLNDVYRMLGIPPTKAGQVVGWIYDSENPCGDNYVDFGIYNGYHEANRNFVNGYEEVILLDFNVDGDILDKI